MCMLQCMDSLGWGLQRVEQGCGCGEIGLARIFGETGVRMCGGKNKCVSV